MIFCVNQCGDDCSVRELSCILMQRCAVGCYGTDIYQTGPSWMGYHFRYQQERVWPLLGPVEVVSMRVRSGDSGSWCLLGLWPDILSSLCQSNIIKTFQVTMDWEVGYMVGWPGKSTILRLLYRFFDTGSGVVRFPCISEYYMHIPMYSFCSDGFLSQFMNRWGHFVSILSTLKWFYALHLLCSWSTLNVLTQFLYQNPILITLPVESVYWKSYFYVFNRSKLMVKT